MKFTQIMNQHWKTTIFGFKNTIVAAFILSVYTRLINGAPQQHNQHHQGCGHEELVQCAQRLHILSDSTELTFVSSKAELDKVCPGLHKGLLCIHSYTLRCMTLSQRNHFHELYRGTSTVIKELCKEGPYQEEFLRHLPCMHSVVKDYEICTMRYQTALEAINKLDRSNETNENDTIKNVCCSFQEYMNCGTNTMRQSCGEEAAQFTRSFMDRMSSNLIKLHCMEYGDDQCSASSATATFALKTTLLTALTAILVTLRGYVLFS
ncbi:uncharacterized protein LOC123296842 [Chrysoperla carnea]|uniref:uncharacterized protein LOC123296842 n=1 Tax=Chrysoperla carnea TaxID=189513 RepID=UPI001D08882A|nr:uncharacterized protein LOC123296842 [Chrysoperla carnea]